MTENTTPEVTPDETATEQAAQDTAQEVTETAVPARETLDVLSTTLLTFAEPKMAELKAIADKQAKVGDVGKLLSEAIESSTNDEVVNRRAAVAKANEAILRITKEMEALVKPTLTIPSEEELNEMELAYKVLASEINSFNSAFQVETSKVYEGLTIFDYLGDMPGKRRGAKAGQGTGTVRPRVSKIEYTTDVNSDEYKAAERNGKSTFSVLSQIVKDETGEVVSAGDFASAWTEQNGVKVEDWATLNESSTFVYSVTGLNPDGEGQKTTEYKVRVTR